MEAGGCTHAQSAHNIKLNETNYQVWKFQLKIILRSRGLLSIVEGNRGKPDITSKTDFIKWMDDDSKAQEIIVTRVQEKILNHLLTCKTSAEIWQKLIAVYEPKSKVSVHLVQQKFFNLKFEEPVTSFISKLEDLRYQLESLGEKMSDTMLITKVLMTLPEKYQHFVSAWESVPESSQSFQSLVSRLLIEEERYGNTEPEPSSALVASQRGRNNYNKSVSEVKCFECGKIGHFRRDCRQRKCHFCHKTGHLIKECRAIKNKSNEGKEDSSKINKNAFIMNPIETVSSDFILDSGASEHMANCKDLFTSFHELSKRYVTVGDGEQLEVKGIGNVDVIAFNGSKYIPTTLNNVLFVPKLNANLFSLACALDKGHTMISTISGCKFLKDEQVVAIADRVDNMYVMNFKFCYDSAALITLSEWHERMAHQNFKYVKQCLNSNNVKYEGQTEQCHSCIQGKQHRLPFSASESQATNPGELIHMDLCGEMTPASLGGSLYFLLIKDDYSSYRYVYFMRHKSETKHKIAEFISQFENEFNCKIKRVRSDNGTEFINREVKEMFKSKGIIHETTVSYTPEQNGRIEREMRTIVESARTMIIQAELNKTLWAEAVNTAVFTINRTGTSKVKDKTPYELLYKKSFDLHKLRIFGTPVYVHIPKEKRSKWDSKSKNGIFVGYGEYCKGYRVWLPNTKKVETHRDVVFIQDKRKEDMRKVQEVTTDVISEMIPEEMNNSDVEEIQNQTDEDLTELLPEQEDQIERQEHENEMCELEVSEENPEENFYDAEVEQESTEETRRQIKRQIKKPAWLNDYVTGLAAQAKEQLSFKEVTSGDDANLWLEAIENEKNALNKNNTWTETELPKGKKPIEAKWVFRIKKDEKGNTQYKARLVARGFQQEEKFDHADIYAPVAKLTTFRILMAISTKFNLHVNQMDVKSAFLYGDIDEEVYLEKPEGFQKDGLVLKLNKSLYGLKRSPRKWNEKFNSALLKEGFVRSQSDWCLYYKKGIKFYILVYVDDILLVGENQDDINRIKEVLQKEFEMKDMHGVAKYLGINIVKKEESIELDQKEYLMDILNCYNMQDCKPVKTPIEPALKISDTPSEDKELITKCRSLIGSLMYAMLGSRPDICFALNYLSRFQSKGNEDLWKALKRVLRYIKGSLDLKLIFNKNIEMPLLGYCDADWGGDTQERKSTSGYMMKVFGCTVSWASSKQQCVSLSSTEAEFVALAKGVSEAVWIRNLLNEIGVKCYDICILEDNQSVIHTTKNPENHKRLKHIDIKLHFVRDFVERKIVKLQYVSTERQLADFFTKPLNVLKFEKCREGLLLC